MADHTKEIEEFGNNDDFWLFGYGRVANVNLDVTLESNDYTEV